MSLLPGIPLASAVAISLSARLDRPVPYSFNRKEAKDHGEKGMIVGHPLTQAGTRVVVVDDVLTAGTAVREVVGLLQQLRCEVVGFVTVFDRMEVAGGEGGGSCLDDRRRSAAEMVEEELGIKVRSVLTVEDLIVYMNEEDEGKQKNVEFQKNIESYRQKYGVFRS
eukprot:GHVS01103074.1.p1 GENE.GHVS01103074.1~~GHVS01103074.1.p1  ORF type:complete len:166 (+),score=44.34 GHVS01103074.1:800-1297(+)